MALSFIAPGASLTAAEWNVISTAQEALLQGYWSGLSQLLAVARYPAAPPQGKYFFFFNPVTPPAGLHPAAYAPLGRIQAQIGGSLGSMPPGYFRQYNHGAITGLIAGLAADANTPNNAVNAAFGVTRLALPDVSAWWSAIWPEGGYGTYNEATSRLLIDLGICLEVLTAGGNAVTFGTKVTTSGQLVTSNGAVEQVLPWDEIQLVIAGNVTFPDTWNKYNFFHIHNFGRAAATVTFGSSLAVTVGPGSSQCVRRTGPGGTYTPGGVYFHKTLPGDPTFYNGYASDDEISGFDPATGFPLYRQPMPNVFRPLQLPLPAAQQLGRPFDLRQLANLGPAYQTAGLTASLGLTSPIGDWLVMQGNVLAVRYNAAGGVFSNTDGSFNVRQLAFTGFANIAAFFAAANPAYAGDGTNGSVAGVTWSFNATTGAVTLTGNTVGYGRYLDFTDVGTNLMAFLAGPNAAGQNKLTLGNVTTPTVTFTPPLGTLTRWQRQQPATSGSPLYYNRYSYDGTNYAKTDLVTVTQENAAINPDGTDTYSVSFNFLDTAQAKLVPFLNALGASGGIGTVGDIALTLTPHGPVLTWTESYPIGAGFNPGTLGLTFSAALGITVTGRTAVAARGQLLTCGNNTWAPLSLTNFNPPWHFPRTERCVGTLRTVAHNGANEPWQPWTTSYTTGEPPNVVNFYEWQPVRPLSVSGVQAAVYSKQGFNSVGALEAAVPPAADLPWADPTGLLLAQWLTAGGGDEAGYLRANYSGGFFPNSTEVTLLEQTTPQLRRQAEHYNIAAGQTNAQPVTPAKGNLGNLGNTSYTLDFRSCFLVEGGTGWQAGFTGTLGGGDPGGGVTITVTAVDANGKITGWDITEESNPIGTFNALATPIRPFAITYTRTVGSFTFTATALFDVATGDGSALTFIPTYGPGGVYLPSGLTGTFWPRGVYFSWNGATDGGADPVQTYLTSLGLTVQSTLPDSFGETLPIYAYVLQPDGSITNTTVTGYVYGCDPDFSARAGTYRWITIDAVRPLYASLSLPFTLNAVVCPYAFVASEVTGNLTVAQDTTVGNTRTYTTASVTYYEAMGVTYPTPLPNPPLVSPPADPTGFNPNVNGFNLAYLGIFDDGGSGIPPATDDPIWATVATYVTPAYIGDGRLGVHFPTVAPANNTSDGGSGAYLGNVNQWAVAFQPSAAGNWVTGSGAGNTLCSPTSPAAPGPTVLGGWQFNADNTAWANFGYNAVSWTAVAVADAIVGGPATDEEGYAWTWTWTWVSTWSTRTVEYQLSYPLPGGFAQPGSVAQTIADPTALVVILEGQASQCAACIPVNYAYLDLGWAAANAPAVAALGTGIVPIITDNTVEDNPADVFICAGAGGEGMYETVITTQLSQAVLQTFSIDAGTAPAGPDIAAGDTGTTPGPDSTPDQPEGVGAGDENVGAGN